MPPMPVTAILTAGLKNHDGVDFARHYWQSPSTSRPYVSMETALQWVEPLLENAHSVKSDSPLSRGRDTILTVSAFLRIIADSVTTLFFVGLAGSAAVILISFVQDLKELFGD